jgi:hypothetical protein
MKQFLMILFLSTFSSGVFASDSTVKLSEDMLLSLSKTTNIPELEKIKANFLGAQAENLKANDTLGTEAYAGYNYSDTDEQPLIPFIPVFTPVHQYQVGVRKNFKYGLQADLSAAVDNRSSANYDSLHTTTYALNLNLDLWKDLFGRVTRKKLDNLSSMAKQAKLQSEIGEKVFRVTLRRVYWSLIANDLKIDISERLFKTAQEQVREARDRKKNSIADASEVARYESQVSSRKGSILLLKYQKETLLKQLRDFVPELLQKEIDVPKVSIDRTIFDVLACTTLIKSKKTPPLDYTQYDELTNLLKRVQFNQEKIDASYDGVDLKLATQFRKIGVGSDPKSSLPNNQEFEGSYQESIDNLEDGFSAGLMLTIPIGKKVAGTTEVIKSYNKKKMKANIQNMDNALETTHRQVTRSILYLGQMIDAQKSNSKSLGIRLKEMKKKYNQARIPVHQLVQDQDALLSSDLSIVDTQLAILNTLLDYFVVFSETPCNFNKR